MKEEPEQYSLGFSVGGRWWDLGRSASNVTFSKSPAMYYCTSKSETMTGHGCRCVAGENDKGGRLCQLVSVL